VWGYPLTLEEGLKKINFSLKMARFVHCERVRFVLVLHLNWVLGGR